MMRTVAIRLTTEEYANLETLATRNNVKVTPYVMAIITDVLVEEGFNGIQRFRPKGSPTGRKRIEASGNPAP